MSQAPLPRALLFLLLLAACDCNETTPPCEREEPIFGCGATCDESSFCRAGLYCEDGLCTADCAADDDCGSNEICNGDGMCEDAPDMGGDTDGRVVPRDGPDGCPSVMVSARRVTPTVILVVDQSGSMTSGFGGSNRWDALRDSLLDPDDGLIQALEDQVRFGLALYSAEAEGNASGPPIGECPMLNEVTAAISNYDAIEAVYADAEPIDETPTGDAINAILDGWLGMPDRPTDPTIFILATDGEPDSCEELNPQNGQEEAITAVTRAYDNGIRTFVISVGSDVSTAHLQDVANAGLGEPATDAEFWVAGDDAGLRGALTSIIGGALSCSLELDSSLEDVSEACMGTVVLNGRELPCDDPNGWEATDENTIELLGDACDELLETPGVTLSATFPCDVGLI